MTKLWTFNLNFDSAQERNAQTSLVRPRPLPTQVSLAVMLAGLVFIGAGWFPGQDAIAQPQPASIALIPLQARLADAMATNTAKQPPAAMVNTLRTDLSKRTGIASNKLQMTESSRQTWPDGCLGLARSGEICTQAMINGWRVTFAQGSRRWVYRTDATGRVYRLEAGAVR